MNRFEMQQPWISASTAEMQNVERTFIRSVYRWMFAGLLLTALTSYWVTQSEAMQQLILANRGASWILLFAELGLVMFLGIRLTRMTPAAAAGAFLAFSALNGLSLSWIFFAYTQASIAQAFFTAAGMFAAMSVYGMVTKKDLTSWGSFFFMGLVGIVICSAINIFVQSTALSMTVAIVGIFVFVGLTAYDTQQLKVMATASPVSLRENFAVFGALRLYLDLINLFILLLRLFGNNRR